MIKLNGNEITKEELERVIAQEISKPKRAEKICLEISMGDETILASETPYLFSSLIHQRCLRGKFCVCLDLDSNLEANLMFNGEHTEFDCETLTLKLKDRIIQF